jgi:hypothetical protein
MRESEGQGIILFFHVLYNSTFQSLELKKEGINVSSTASRT